MYKLLPLLLLIPLFGMGQKITTTLLHRPQSLTLENRVHIANDTIVTNPKYDTLRVLMLVCDTTKISRWKFVGATLKMDSSWVKNEVYWIIGYEVKQYIQSRENTFDGGADNSYWEHFTYLDDKRKPLSPNIVVWLTK